MNIVKTFEDYLKEVHAKNYTGQKDKMSEDFESWLSNLGGEDCLNWGNPYAQRMFDEGMLDGKIEIINKLKL